MNPDHTALLFKFIRPVPAQRFIINKRFRSASLCERVNLQKCKRFKYISPCLSDKKRLWKMLWSTLKRLSKEEKSSCHINPYHAFVIPSLLPYLISEQVPELC
jgi:hypothetical protein